MKRLLILLFILVFATSAWADIDTLEGMAIDTSTTIEGQSGLAAIEGATIVDTETCTSLSTHTVDDSNGDIGTYNNQDYYRGMVFKDAGAAHDICKLVANLTKVAGDISGYTYYAQVWSMTGNDLNAQEGSDSTGVTGNNGWSDTPVTFTFATPITLTADTSYAIVITRKGVDNSNYACWRYDSGGATMLYCDGFGKWENDGTNVDLVAADDPEGEIWDMQ